MNGVRKTQEDTTNFEIMALCFRIIIVVIYASVVSLLL